MNNIVMTLIYQRRDAIKTVEGEKGYKTYHVSVNYIIENLFKFPLLFIEISYYKMDYFRDFILQKYSFKFV